ncbi:hypothetical protein OPV22_032337 [Ensete ventricosum]|uniref:THH1/TOM1/TOM3 domain-containing protein n=1 Tax=Ensete ventricosum TaxID=4639 RepID=A0AAV8P263_ENSVE|nr:hypothetical protein OPV22_032337 [Ensete ventricosum]
MSDRNSHREISSLGYDGFARFRGLAWFLASVAQVMIVVAESWFFVRIRIENQRQGARRFNIWRPLWLVLCYAGMVNLDGMCSAEVFEIWSLSTLLCWCGKLGGDEFSISI